MIIIRAAGLGLLIALVGQFIALLLAGAGHGWVSPTWISVVLWAAYPFVLARAAYIASAGYGSLWLEPLALLVALAADVQLFLMTRDEGFQYVVRMHHDALGLACQLGSRRYSNHGTASPYAGPGRIGAAGFPFAKTAPMPKTRLAHRQILDQR